jgi:uncharacterized membrane protein YphA (DoxX/SURF4 family)
MSYVGIIALLFGLTLILVTIASLLLRGPIRPGETTVNTPARIFLVLLRLAIGWHCFVEGMDKLHNPAWSSEAYLREAIGPLVPAYRWLAGDRLLDRLVMVDNEHEPAGLAADYDAYTEAFVAHHGLDEKQTDRAHDIARQGKSKAITWITATTETVTKIAQYPPPLKVDWTVSERLEEYDRLRAKVSEVEAKLPTSDKDFLKRYTDAKANANKWRGDLKKSYDAQFAGFKKSLVDVLSAEQKKDATPVPEPVVLPVTQWSMLDWSDRAVAWGLVVVGGGLMLGLFARLCSGAGALLVLSFFLAMPPLPGWPESPRLEGHYLFINKTLIEVLALGALAFLPTGRWAGIDALLHLLWPPNWRRAPSEIRSGATRREREPIAPIV